MANVIVQEGHLQQVYICPNCSKHYPLKDGENDLPPPEECSRCGSPMDVDGGRDFSHQATLPTERATVESQGPSESNKLSDKSKSKPRQRG